MISRWTDYFFTKNEDYHDFWQNYLKNGKNILFILGNGFDPRMCIGLESILQKGGLGKRDCVLISFTEGANSPSLNFRADVKANKAKLNELIDGKGTIQEKSINMETDSEHRVGSRRAAKIFNDYSDFEEYTDIIVDISSLPLNVYFLLIGKILFILDSFKNSNTKKCIANLHVIVTENTQIDKSIKKSGLSDGASYLHGFTGNLEVASKEEDPTVWIPILGEGQKEQIELIGNFVSPREICPVLPSPSVEPRRGDEIMLEYRDLMDRLSIETRNIIYGSEQNPFELYRQIYKTIEHYRNALKPLGNSKFAISSLSGKLMSMGSFLVAYEEGLSKKESVGIAYVESKGYSMEPRAKNEDILKSCELFSLWIFGDCYDGATQ